MSKLEIFLWLTQAPNTSMQISRNKGATKKASRKIKVFSRKKGATRKASRKIVHDKVF